MADETVVKRKGVNLIIVDEPVTEPEPEPTPEFQYDVVASSTETLPAGSLAVVEKDELNSIPNKKTAFKFKIPQGLKGEQGIPGTGGGGNVSLGKGYADVTNFDARGDGVEDDADAFTRAWNSISGTGGDLIVPPPNNFYNFKTTFQALPPGGAGQVWVNILCRGQKIQNGIKYTGPSNAPIIRAVGIKPCRWEGLKIEIMPGRSNVQCIDFFTQAGANSETGITLANFYLFLGDGNNQGMRFDKPTGGNGDISLFNFENIDVYGTTKPGQWAWQSNGPNVLAMNVYGGFVAQCEGIFSNWSTDVPPNDSDRGGACWYFYGVHTSGNLCCFESDREGTLAVFGGRYEHDGLMLRTRPGSHSVAFTMSGARLNDNRNPQLFQINQNITLKIDNCHLHKENINNAFPNGFVDLIALASPGPSSIEIAGGSSRYQNLIKRVGGSANCKLYMRGHTRFHAAAANFIEAHMPDVNGQPV